MSRDHWGDLLAQISVLMVDCPKCGAESGTLCRGLWVAVTGRTNLDRITASASVDWTGL